MGPPSLRAFRLLLALASLSACDDGAPAGSTSAGGSGGGCASDDECGPGRRCEASACVDVEPTAACALELDPACGDGQLCAAELDALCAGEGGCAAPSSCRAPVGAVEGSFRCAADDECRSGRCLEGVCLRLCRTSEHCDGTPCVEREGARGARASFCLPVDEAGGFAPEHPRCDADRDCAEGQLCRRRSGNPYSLEPHGFCAASDPTLREVGERCEVGNLHPESTSTPEALAADATCRSNSCEFGCLSGGPLVCRQPRCTRPCRADADCPERTTCQVFTRGDVVVPLQTRSCLLPRNGCFDDLDCCPSVDAQGLCVDGWDQSRSSCAAVGVGGRLLTVCGASSGSLEPGEACTDDATCASGLCLTPAPAWSAATPGMCASFCREDEDRCAELTGVPEARCTPTPLARDGVEGALPVCR